MRGCRKYAERPPPCKKAAEEAEADDRGCLRSKPILRTGAWKEPLRSPVNAADTPVIEDLIYSDGDEDDEEAGNIQYGAAPPPVRKPSLFRVSFYIDADIETQGLLVKFMNENNIHIKSYSGWQP